MQFYTIYIRFVRIGKNGKKLLKTNYLYPFNINLCVNFELV